MRLPSWLTERLQSCPKSGEGVHDYLYSVARQLHAHMDREQCFDALRQAVAGCERHVPDREIRDAVNNSYATRWEPKGSSQAVESAPLESKPATPRRDQIDPMARTLAIMQGIHLGVPSCADLWERSPVKVEWTANQWLAWLFPGAEWLCLSLEGADRAETHSPAWWEKTSHLCGLVVPSPMSKAFGKNLSGKITARCLDNTGPRRWLVIEFDNGTFDQQASLHWHLRALALECGWPPLRLVVHSAGKSTHGWFGPVESEEHALPLMKSAVAIGADPATWTRCQMIRLPGGRRKTKQVPAELPEWAEPEEYTSLEVLYFDPAL